MYEGQNYGHVGGPDRETLWPRDAILKSLAPLGSKRAAFLRRTQAPKVQLPNYKTITLIRIGFGGSYTIRILGILNHNITNYLGCYITYDSEDANPEHPIVR